MQRSRPHNAVMYGQPLDKTHLQAERSGCEKEGGDDGQIAGQCAPVIGAEAERERGGRWAACKGAPGTGGGAMFCSWLQLQTRGGAGGFAGKEAAPPPSR